MLRDHAPAVGGIGPLGPVSGERLVALRVPVMRDGALRNVLTVALRPDAVGAILRSAGIPDGWVGAVVDRGGDLVARSVDDATTVGLPASPSARHAIAAGTSGFYPGVTRDGVPVETVFETLPAAGGWSVHRGIPRRALGERVRWLQDLTGTIGRDLHRVAGDLRPTALDDLGLPRALAALAQDWSARYEIQADVQVIGSEERLPDEVATAIYRVVQEALTNVLKHARARTVSVVLDRRPRETDVLRLTAQGFSNKEIANRLDVGVKTVETYKARAADKLGLRSRAEVVHYGVAKGWLAGLADGR